MTDRHDHPTQLPSVGPESPMLLTPEQAAALDAVAEPGATISWMKAEGGASAREVAQAVGALPTWHVPRGEGDSKAIGGAAASHFAPTLPPSMGSMPGGAHPSAPVPDLDLPDLDLPEMDGPMGSPTLPPDPASIARADASGGAMGSGMAARSSGRSAGRSGGGSWVHAIGPSGDFPLPDGVDPEQEGEFVLREMIAEGGMGEVWRAWQKSLRREVAVKRLKTGSAGEFVREAMVSAELDHPNIVPVHDMARSDDSGLPMLAMKMVSGTPWNAMLAEDRAKPDFALEGFLAKHLRVLLDICNAVAYAHSKSVIHRDLKPAQVMVGRFGEVYLMDWGLAVSLRADASAQDRLDFSKPHSLHTTRNQCGTPAFMAPEQTEPTTKNLGRHTDIYLLGGILFELIAGEPPHSAPTTRRAYEKAMVNETGRLPLDCPAELKAIVERALATEPQYRYGKVEQFRDAIEDYLAGAGKRRESMALVTSARERWDREGPSYQVLAWCGHALARAQGLWAENAEAAKLAHEVQVAYANAALANDDLMLARLQARQIQDDAAREIMARRVEEKIAAKERSAKTRRVLAIGGACLVALLLGALAWFAYQQRKTIGALEATRDRLERNASGNLRLKGDLDQAAFERNRAVADFDKLMAHMTSGVPDALDEKNPGDGARALEGLDASLWTFLEPRQTEKERERGAAETWRLLDAEFDAAEKALAEGKLDDAARLYGELRVRARALHASKPDFTMARYLVAKALEGSARTLLAQRSPAVAAQRFLAGIAILDELLAVDAAREPWLMARAFAAEGLAQAREAEGKAEEALEAYRDAASRFEVFAADDPTRVRVRHALGDARFAIGKLLLGTGRAAEALPMFESALSERERIAKLLPFLPGDDLSLSTGKFWMARALEALGRRGDAIAAQREGLAEIQALVEAPEGGRWVGALRASQTLHARSLLSAGASEAALALFREVREAEVADAAKSPKDATLAIKAQEATARVAEALLARGDFDAANALLEEIAEPVAARASRKGAAMEARLLRAEVETALGRIAAERGDFVGAFERSKAAVEALEGFELSADPALRAARGAAFVLEGSAREGLGDPEQALAPRRKALESFEPLCAPNAATRDAARALQVEALAGAGKSLEAKAAARALADSFYRDPGFLRFCASKALLDPEALPPVAMPE